MREIKCKPIDPPSQPEVPYNKPFPKYFVKALRCKEPAKRMRNEIVDMVYTRILSNVKELYSGLADPSSRTVCERNRKRDLTCAEAIWNFATPSFRFNWTCDPFSQYWINYDFYNCPFENEVMELFNDGGLIRYMERQISPDYQKYFNYLLENYKESCYTLKSIQP